MHRVTRLMHMTSTEMRLATPSGGGRRLSFASPALILSLALLWFFSNWRRAALDRGPRPQLGGGGSRSFGLLDFGRVCGHSVVVVAVASHGLRRWAEESAGKLLFVQLKNIWNQLFF